MGIEGIISKQFFWCFWASQTLYNGSTLEPELQTQLELEAYLKSTLSLLHNTQAYNHPIIDHNQEYNHPIFHEFDHDQAYHHPILQGFDHDQAHNHPILQGFDYVLAYHHPKLQGVDRD